MSKLTLYIARHGKTMMNTLDRVQGWCDSPLTDEGIQVAEYLGKGLKDIEFRAAYCSDLQRTAQTAGIVLKNKGQENLPITQMAGFKEACFGSFEAGSNLLMWSHAGLYLQHSTPEKLTQSIVDGKTSYADVLNVIKELDTINMAESFDQVESRTQAALHAVVKRESDKGDANILIIAHGMSISSMLWNMGGKELMDGILKNASVCKITYENGIFTVQSMGDMSYVEKGKSMP